MSQRFLLKGTSVKVLEVAPPSVLTELMGEQMAADPRTMPLKENSGPKEAAFVNQFNDMMAQEQHQTWTKGYFDGRLPGRGSAFRIKAGGLPVGPGGTFEFRGLQWPDHFY